MIDFFLIAILVYAALVVALYALQRKLIYLPDKAILPPQEYGLEGFSDERTGTTDGVFIQLWYRKANEGFPTVIYFHGNAAHIGNRAGMLGALAAKGFGVLGVSYRGYGRSDGTPHEEGLYNDARAAIKFLTNSRGVTLSRVIIYGESLGTGVAVQMASEYAVGMLVLQAPYTSVAGRAAELYYYVPVKLLIKDRYDSILKIEKVKAPLMIFHGELDATIPIAHGKKLFEKALSTKRSFFLPDVNHNDFDSGLISSHVLDFAKELGLITQ